VDRSCLLQPVVDLLLRQRMILIPLHQIDDLALGVAETSSHSSVSFSRSTSARSVVGVGWAGHNFTSSVAFFPEHIRTLGLEGLNTSPGNTALGIGRC
jgi:hypothetical protein